MQSRHNPLPLDFARRTGFTGRRETQIVRLLVERIDLAPDGMQVRLRAEGLQTLVEELQSREAKAA
jgi:hypothetical protein